MQPPAWRYGGRSPTGSSAASPMAALPRARNCRGGRRSPRTMAALAERGLVRAERGSGTYVEAQKLAYPLRSRTRFSEIVGAGGQEPRGQLIDAAQDVATRARARQLDLKTGEPLIRIEALRSADRTPICISTTWLSAERFPDAGSVFASVRSMTKLLAHYGIRDYRRASTKITAAIADADDAARLG